MNDDYLWDGSGEPDPEIQRLESVLGRLRHHGPTPVFPEQSRFPGWLLRKPWMPRLVTALALLLLLAAGGLVVRHQIAPGSAWQVSRLAGKPQVGAKHIAEIGHLAVGQWIVTDAASKAILNAGSVGQVQVDPGTRIRLIETQASKQVMELESGTIHAMIWASPGQFVVETPSAWAVDLGCAYTLRVDDRGAGLVRVTFGWVGFKLDGRESFIPEGAACATRPGVGPGTPYFDDASPNLREALEKLDFGNASPVERTTALNVVLEQARPRDALTLWHLLSRLSGSDRENVYSRLAGLVPPPRGVTREGILAGDQAMLDSWWNQFGYGRMDWWRRWERAWPELAK